MHMHLTYVYIYTYIDLDIYIYTYIHACMHTYITYIHTLHYITLHCITLQNIHTYQCVLFLIEVDNYLSRQIRSRTPVGTGTLLSHLSSLCSTNHSRGGEWHSQRVSSVCVYIYIDIIHIWAPSKSFISQ